MTKQERIEEFDNYSDFLQIVKGEFKIKGCYLVQIFETLINDTEIDSFIKELTEAKEIMEMKDDE